MNLKRWSYEDTSDLTRFANNKKIANNLRDFFPHPYTEENAKQFIEFCINTPDKKQVNRAISFCNQTIGSISLTIGEDIYRKSAEIGYWIGEEFWGNGIATRGHHRNMSPCI